MLDQHAIRTRLPQRHPLLLVDRAVEEDGAVTASKAVTISEHCYRRLFEWGGAADFSYPVSLLVEGLSQAAGLLLHRKWPEMSRAEHVVMFGAFAGIRVLGHAYPGDRLELRAALETVHDDVAIISGEVTCDGRALLQVERIVAVKRPASAVDLAGGAP